VSYGLAAAVGLSRITGSEHFVSDVFVGGVLGYSIGRFAVLRQ
jgi:membrane-associated phospholipid phosphatase